MSPEYLAGIMDGEGNIRIAVSCYKYRYVRLQIVNTHRPLLDKIQENYGGKVCWHYKGGDKKMAWKWNTSGANAERILHILLPFLIVKRDDALKALAAEVSNKRAA